MAHDIVGVDTSIFLCLHGRDEGHEEKEGQGESFHDRE
jgi:hypothetical protein